MMENQQKMFEYSSQQWTLHGQRHTGKCQNFHYFGQQCCGSRMFILDPGSASFLSRIPHPNCFHPGSRIQIVSIPDPHQRIKVF